LSERQSRVSRQSFFHTNASFAAARSLSQLIATLDVATLAVERGARPKAAIDLLVACSLEDASLAGARELATGRPGLSTALLVLRTAALYSTVRRRRKLAR
jgi:hypothetical protein